MKAVYLIHFWKKYRSRSGKCMKEVQHYIGSTEDLERRIYEHRSSYCDEKYLKKLASREASGNCGLIRIVNTLEINWHVSLIFHDQGLDYEYSLKGRKENPQICPQCRFDRGQDLHRFRNLHYTSIIHQTGSSNETLDLIYNPGACTQQRTPQAFFHVASIPQIILRSKFGTAPRQITVGNQPAHPDSGINKERPRERAHPEIGMQV